VAGETRRQRRDARRAEGQQTPPPERPGAPQPVEAAAAGPAGTLAPAPSGGFIRSSWSELQKVEWPNRNQVIQGTIVVIIACAIVGAYLWGVDQILRPFVRDVLLGQ
jgi:preprotein translocase subunit SecE